MGQMTQSTAS